MGTVVLASMGLAVGANVLFTILTVGEILGEAVMFSDTVSFGVTVSPGVGDKVMLKSTKSALGALVGVSVALSNSSCVVGEA